MVCCISVPDSSDIRAIRDNRDIRIIRDDPDKPRFFGYFDFPLLSFYIPQRCYYFRRHNYSNIPLRLCHDLFMVYQIPDNLELSSCTYTYYQSIPDGELIWPSLSNL